MLTLHYNGYNIPTGSGFSIRVSWVNPLCFFDQLPGNAGLGIEIPVNQYSRAIFGNPGRFEKYTAAVSRKFPGFQVRYSGVLLIDGTFGMSSYTNPSSQQTNTIVGDINIEYVLTKNRRWRIRAFNRTNTIDDLYNNATYTQGIGLSYQREFSTIKELFSGKKKNN